MYNKLIDNKNAIGVLVRNNCPLIVENVSMMGIDFVLMDRQHGMWDLENLTFACRSAYYNNVIPMVNVRKNDYSEIGLVLDRGAKAILVPMVNTFDEAVKAADSTYYPPKGNRSLGAFGVGFLGENYVENIQDDIFLGVTIETKEAIKNMREILSVDGINGCFIGPGDLAKDYGIENGGHYHEEIILKALETCLELKKLPGILGGRAKYWTKRGFKIAILGAADIYIKKGLEEDLEKYST